MYCFCKIKVNDAFILIYNLTPLNLSHNYDNKQYSQKHISDSFLLIIDLNHFFYTFSHLKYPIKHLFFP